MSHKKYKTSSYCPGGRHYSNKKSIEGGFSKTGRKLLIGNYVKCIKTKSIFVSDNPIQARELSNIFENIGKHSAKVAENKLEL